MVESSNESASMLARALYGEAAVGYVAGMIDGEGCISAWMKSGRKHQVSVYLTIVNRDTAALEFCQKIIGGRIRVHQKGDPLKGHSTSYKLIITDRETVKRALKVVLPFLIIKKILAELTIALIDILGEYHMSGYMPLEMEILSEIKELNRRRSYG